MHACELAVKKFVFFFWEHIIFLFQDSEILRRSNDLTGGSLTILLHGHYCLFYSADVQVCILCRCSGLYFVAIVYVG